MLSVETLVVDRRNCERQDLPSLLDIITPAKIQADE
jgi:hypothetical protein